MCVVNGPHDVTVQRIYIYICVMHRKYMQSDRCIFANVIYCHDACRDGTVPTPRSQCKRHRHDCLAVSRDNLWHLRLVKMDPVDFAWHLVYGDVYSRPSIYLLHGSFPQPSVGYRWRVSDAFWRRLTVSRDASTHGTSIKLDMFISNQQQQRARALSHYLRKKHYNQRRQRGLTEARPVTPV